MGQRRGGTAAAVLFGLYLVLATSCGSDGSVAATAATATGSGGAGGASGVTTDGSSVGSTGSGATGKPRGELVSGGARLESKTYQMDVQIGHAFWQEPVAGQTQTVDGTAVIK